jgi:hypothetical protein
MKETAMSIARGILLVVVGYLLLVMFVLLREVPSDCRTAVQIWSVLIEATLPLLIVIAINYWLVGFCLRRIRRRILLFIAGFGWATCVLLSAALAVELAGSAVFRAADAMGYSMDALQQCVPRMATDFLNATAGWLFWAAVAVLLVTGVLAAERALRDASD